MDDHTPTMTTENSMTAQVAQDPVTPVPTPLPPPIRLLNQEERNDLRKRVLSGEELSLEEAKAVFDTIRQGRGAAALANEAKPKKSRAKKAGMTDQELGSSLDAAFGSIPKKP